MVSPSRREEIGRTAPRFSGKMFDMLNLHIRSFTIYPVKYRLHKKRIGNDPIRFKPVWPDILLQQRHPLYECFILDRQFVEIDSAGITGCVPGYNLRAGTGVTVE